MLKSPIIYIDLFEVISLSLIYKPTPPEARGVGTYSKTYPGMLGLKSISLPLIILVSETPIMLNSKFNSSNR